MDVLLGVLPWPGLEARSIFSRLVTFCRELFREIMSFVLLFPSSQSKQRGHNS